MKVQRGLTVYVKRRSGCLPYSEDPYGQRSLSARGRKGSGGSHASSSGYSLLSQDLM